MRIATFNIENLDEQKPDRDGKLQGPTLAERFAILRPQLERVDADILWLQEVHGQEREGEARALLTLAALLEGTRYAGWHQVTTLISEGQPYEVRNFVIVSRFPILAQHHGDRRTDGAARDVHVLTSSFV